MEASMANEKNPAAVSLGTLGGRKGGVARATKLTSAERKMIAQVAAQARWATRDLEALDRSALSKGMADQMPDMSGLNKAFADISGMAALSRSMAAQTPDMSGLTKAFADISGMAALSRSMAAQTPDMSGLTKAFADISGMAALSKSMAARMPDMSGLNKAFADISGMAALSKSMAAQMPDLEALSKSLAAQVPGVTRTWMLRNPDLVAVGAALANQVADATTVANETSDEVDVGTVKRVKSRRRRRNDDVLTPEQTAALAWLCALIVLYCTSMSSDSHLSEDLRAISLGTIGSLIVWGLAQYYERR
jgi:hypothetical protein